MIIGHQRILNLLKKSVEKNHLAHAYLFSGPSHLGKKRVALKFVEILNGLAPAKNFNPDILIIEPEAVEKNGTKKELEIGIDQARKIQRQISLSPYQSSYKIIIIDQAEKMTFQASNCLLKTLEEPAGNSVLILITARPQMLLPTIVSRCQIIKFLPVAQGEIEKSVKNPKLARLANGRPGLAINYSENPELLENHNRIISQLEELLRSDLNKRYQYVEEMSKDVSQARQTLNDWLFWFRDLLLLSVNCPKLTLYQNTQEYHNCYSLPKLRSILKAIRETDWLLSNPSINARLSLEVLMLEF
jgi:DNA polymerase III subunit delta'